MASVNRLYVTCMLTWCHCNMYLTCTSHTCNTHVILNIHAGPCKRACYMNNISSRAVLVLYTIRGSISALNAVDKDVWTCTLLSIANTISHLTFCKILWNIFLNNTDSVYYKSSFLNLIFIYWRWMINKANKIWIEKPLHISNQDRFYQLGNLSVWSHFVYHWVIHYWTNECTDVATGNPVIYHLQCIIRSVGECPHLY